MGLVKDGTLFLAFFVLLSNFQSTMQGRPFKSDSDKGKPAPHPTAQPTNPRLRYYIENNNVHLIGTSTGVPVVVNDLFLGVFEGAQFVPVNPNNPLSLIHVRELRTITVTEQERTQLLNMFHQRGQYCR